LSTRRSARGLERRGEEVFSRGRRDDGPTSTETRSSFSWLQDRDEQAVSGGSGADGFRLRRVETTAVDDTRAQAEEEKGGGKNKLQSKEGRKEEAASTQEGERGKGGNWRLRRRCRCALSGWDEEEDGKGRRGRAARGMKTWADPWRRMVFFSATTRYLSAQHCNGSTCCTVQR